MEMLALYSACFNDIFAVETLLTVKGIALRATSGFPDTQEEFFWKSE